MKTITYAQKNKDKKRQINRKTKQKETWKNIYKLSMTDNYVTNKYNDNNRKEKTFKVTEF